MQRDIDDINIGITRAADIELELFGELADSLCGHVKGSQAYDLLREHAERYRDQSLLGRGFEKYDGKELMEHDISMSRKQTAIGLRRIGMGYSEASETIRAVERKVSAALTKVLGREVTP